MKKLRQLAAVILICIMFMTLNQFEAKAAEANIAISSATVATGETVTVDVTVSSSEVLGTYEIYLTYDETILEYKSGADGGGGGRVKLVFMDMNEVKSNSSSLVFEAKNAGTANVSVDKASSSVFPLNGNDDGMSITSASGSVTVTAPVEASSDNTLASLTVTAILSSGDTREIPLTPGFSSDVIEYRADLGEDVESLSIAAATVDATAQMSVKGTRIDPGDNLTYIIVTAQNGDQKTYNIYTTKPIPETTPSVETTPEEVTTEIIGEDIKVTIGDVEYTIAASLEGIDIPEGFEETVYVYKEANVKAIKGLVKNLTALYLLNAEGKGAFYIYSETEDSFFRMRNVQVENKLYTILKFTDAVTIPKGYEKTTQKVGNNKITVYKKDEKSEYCLVYAMNWDGESNLYIYDTKENTMQRYSTEAEEGLDNPIEQENPTTNSNESQLKEDLEKLQAKYDDNNSFKWKIIIGLSIVCVLLILLAISLLMKMDDKHKDGEDSADIDEPLAEINLDMITAINEPGDSSKAADIEEDRIYKDDQTPADNEEENDKKTETEIEDDLDDSDIEERIGKMARELEQSLMAHTSGDTILPDFDTGNLPNIDDLNVNDIIRNNQNSDYDYLDE